MLWSLASPGVHTGNHLRCQCGACQTENPCCVLLDSPRVEQGWVSCAPRAKLDAVRQQGQAEAEADGRPGANLGAQGAQVVVHGPGAAAHHHEALEGQLHHARGRPQLHPPHRVVPAWHSTLVSLTSTAVARSAGSGPVSQQQATVQQRLRRKGCTVSRQKRACSSRSSCALGGNAQEALPPFRTMLHSTDLKYQEEGLTCGRQG